MAKGAASIAAVDAAYLMAMEAGEAEARTLSEGLAIDFAKLLRAAFPGADAAALERAKGEGITKRMELAGRLLLEAQGVGVVAEAGAHRSDTVRGWACYALAALPGLGLLERLERVKVLAEDPHFGVREWAWLAMRPAIAAELSIALEELAGWTGSSSEGIRRFASEATRPRGVWCVHLNELKERPKRGLRLLEPLRADGSLYVRNSVANWLNDAGKSQPDWVRGLCRKWEKESPCAETAMIVKRALRNLKDSGAIPRASARSKRS
jgi:3-methyladenine DNA glycosylase AlkC